MAGHWGKKSMIIGLLFTLIIKSSNVMFLSEIKYGKEIQTETKETVLQFTAGWPLIYLRFSRSGETFA